MASGSNQEVNATVSQSPTDEYQQQDTVAPLEHHHGQDTPPDTVNQEESTQQHNLHSAPAVVLRPEIAKAPVTLPEGIWNTAYDRLAAKEVRLVQAYEKILSSKLGRKSADTLDPTTEQNAIERHNVLVRRTQMHQLIQDGLEKVTRETKVKKDMGTALQVAIATKRLVTDAVRDIPQAALPWAIVSVSLEMLMNPISETKSNHEGVEYIGITIQWYWEQAAHLFDSLEGDRLSGVQKSLYSAFIGFYETLLQFQMSSICSYYRHRGFVFLQDIVKLDDWEGRLNSIRKDDEALKEKIAAFLRLESGSHLKGLVDHTKIQETYQETREDQQCLRDLRITDPSADRDRIENTKGGLLQDSYRWILENRQFKTWRDSDGNRLLWLRGDPGKGKTMLLCGLIQELRQQSAPCLVTFFFCQATDPKNNNGTAVLRGLIWLLANKQPSLISHVRKVYDPAGKNAFDDGNAWYTLSDIFENMLGHEGLPPVSIVIDALDECTEGRTELLDIIRKTSTLPNVKWIVSSRNWNDIEEKLSDGMNLSLEVNATLVKTAVEAYIAEKASQISLLKQDDGLRKEVCRRMQEKANGTFLWVAIVFERLNAAKYAHYDHESEILDLLDDMPGDLSELYGVMLKRISQLGGRGPELCRTILAIVTVAYRPLHLNELSTLMAFKGNLKKPPRLKELINDCGSFLTVRENVVYFIHQSATEFLAHGSLPRSIIFPQGEEKIHYQLVLNSLDAMSHILKKNVYGLEHPGFLVDDISPPEPNPLHDILYSCTNWVAHVCAVTGSRVSSHLHNDLVNDEKILGFLKTHFLHWLEALSLSRHLPDNISSIKRLNELLKTSAKDGLHDFVYDASRFMQYHAQIMESAPLQIYVSALLFSPAESLVRTQFSDDLFSWICVNPATSGKWSPCLQEIEINRYIESVDSNGTNLLILSSDSQTVEIWDIASGRRTQMLKHLETVRLAKFLSDSGRIITFTERLISLWNANTGTIISERSIHGLDIDWAGASASSDGKLVAFHTEEAIEICDVVQRTKLQIPHFATPFGTIRGQLQWSNDSKFLACEGLVKRMSDAMGGMIQLESDFSSSCFRSVSFPTDSKLIAIADESVVTLWDSESEVKILTLRAPYIGRFSLAEFSKDGELIAARGTYLRSRMSKQVVIVWDTITGKIQHELFSDHPSLKTKRLIWLDDARALAVVHWYTIEIYDLSERTFWNLGGDKEIGQIACRPFSFSTDLRLAATIYSDFTHIWATATGNKVQTLDYRLEPRSQLVFSSDCRTIYAHSPERGFSALDIASNLEVGTPYSTVLGQGQPTVAAFSLDGNYLAEAPSDEKWIRVWDFRRQQVVQQLTVHQKVETPSLLAFSNNSKYLVLLSVDTQLDIWNTETGEKEWETGETDWTKQNGNICEVCHRYAYTEATIAVSNDGKMVLFAEPRRHRMWILTKGNDKDKFKRQPFWGDFEPSFDTESPCILTRLGRIHLDTLLAHGDDLQESHNYQFMTQGYGLSYDRSWVTWNGREIIWLPPSYRPGGMRAIFHNFLVMDIVSRGAFSIRFSGPPPPF